MTSRDELVARYDADTDFPGYNMSSWQVEHFWQISANYLQEQSARNLKSQLEQILANYGKDSDDAMNEFLGSDNITGLLNSYDQDEDWAYVDDDNWKEAYLIENILYLNNNYSDQLEEIWMNETRWGFWCYFNDAGYGWNSKSEEAFNAVVEFLSGYSNLSQWIGVC